MLANVAPMMSSSNQFSKKDTKQNKKEAMEEKMIFKIFQIPQLIFSIDFLIDLYVVLKKTKINKALLVIIFTFFRIRDDLQLKSFCQKFLEKRTQAYLGCFQFSAETVYISTEVNDLSDFERLIYDSTITRVKLMDRDLAKEKITPTFVCLDCDTIFPAIHSGLLIHPLISFDIALCILENCKLRVCYNVVTQR